MRLSGFLCGLVLSLMATVVAAQDTWVQIEAQPSLREGEERARAYSGVFPNVNGFAMTTGWYAIALGPFSPEEAQRQLELLRGERLIPGDSYIADSARFGQQFWPVGGATPAPSVSAPEAEPEVAALPEALPDETPAEARRSESLLLGEERRELQEALQWQGFYAGAIDGAFGPGTRRSMAAWQGARGADATGILTTRQRAALIEEYEAERDAIGLATVADAEAGIEIALPTALVEFDRYAPPFAHYRERDGSGFRAILISQQGDQATLAGLYEVMQTLEIVPVSGERGLGRTSFTLSGQNSRLHSYTQAELKGGAIHGFALVWPPEEEARAARILDAMKAAFRPAGDVTLDPGLGAPLAENRADLVSGLEIRRPTLSRSGFYIDGTGLVATTDEVLANCGRVTLDSQMAADIALHDDASGLVVLKPATTLAPRAHARFADGRVSSEVAVAGFSYEDALDSAVLSFGTMAAAEGLDGEAGITRLSVKTLAGDAGGPVLDATGSVIGMLLPRANDAGRILPDDVGLALDGSAISAVLAEAGLGGEPAATSGDSRTLAPEDLAIIGRDLTVLVSCWN